MAGRISSINYIKRRVFSPMDRLMCLLGSRWRRTYFRGSKRLKLRILGMQI